MSFYSDGTCKPFTNTAVARVRVVIAGMPAIILPCLVSKTMLDKTGMFSLNKFSFNRNDYASIKFNVICNLNNFLPSKFYDLFGWAY